MLEMPDLHANTEAFSSALHRIVEEWLCPRASLAYVGFSPMCVCAGVGVGVGGQEQEQAPDHKQAGATWGM